MEMTKYEAGTPSWIDLGTPDLEGAIASVPPQDIPPGRCAVLNDPHGTVFSVIKMSPNMGG